MKKALNRAPFVFLPPLWSLRQQQFQIMYQRLGILIMLDEQTDMPLRIKDITAGGMVHRVTACCLTRYFLIKDLEFLGHFGRGSIIAIQAKEALVKSRYILRQYRLRITRRIDRHKQHLYALSLRAQCVHHIGHLSHGGRANIRALRVAKEHQHYLAFEISQSTWFAMMIGQCKVLGVIQASDIGIDEFLTATRRA